ncbi:MAG: tetratricopeptide repeat protein, partial [Candidatus Eremiobacteraeota bacterium]|nr:tetratricopeptide repeat protein [Candidatus Eremiobacteraeota bacterium]
MKKATFQLFLVCLICAAVCGASARAASPTPQPHAQSAAQLLAQAETASAQGHNQTARELLHQAVALEPGNMAAQKLLGDVEYRLEHYTEALSAYKIVLAHDPANKDVHNRLGGVYAALDNLDAAIAEFRSSLPLSEGFANLVQSYADQGKLSDLEAEYERAEEHNPFEYVNHYNLGYI